MEIIAGQRGFHGGDKVVDPEQGIDPLWLNISSYRLPRVA
jgi:hypothetical protein